MSELFIGKSVTYYCGSDRYGYKITFISPNEGYVFAQRNNTNRIDKFTRRKNGKYCPPGNTMSMFYLSLTEEEDYFDPSF